MGTFRSHVGDNWMGGESSGKSGYLSIAMEIFQYLTTNMAVQMCSSGVVALDKCPRDQAK